MCLCNAWSAQCSVHTLHSIHTLFSFILFSATLTSCSQQRAVPWHEHRKREREWAVCAVWDWAVVVMATDRWYCQSIESLFDAACNCVCSHTASGSLCQPLNVWVHFTSLNCILNDLLLGYKQKYSSLKQMIRDTPGVFIEVCENTCELLYVRWNLFLTSTYAKLEWIFSLSLVYRLWMFCMETEINLLWKRVFLGFVYVRSSVVTLDVTSSLDT